MLRVKCQERDFFPSAWLHSTSNSKEPPSLSFKKKKKVICSVIQTNLTYSSYSLKTQIWTVQLVHDWRQQTKRKAKRFVFCCCFLCVTPSSQSLYLTTNWMWKLRAHASNKVLFPQGYTTPTTSVTWKRERGSALVDTRAHTCTHTHTFVPECKVLSLMIIPSRQRTVHNLSQQWFTVTLMVSSTLGTFSRVGFRHVSV